MNKQQGLKQYKYKNRRIGVISWDNHTFILFRKKSQIVRKYNAIGISTRILIDLIESGCEIIIIKMDNVAKYTITPRDWLEKGITDRLTPTQDYHAFYPLDKLKRFGE